jgi:DnaJ-class molecular chaperone
MFCCTCSYCKGKGKVVVTSLGPDYTKKEVVCPVCNGSGKA